MLGRAGAQVGLGGAGSPGTNRYAPLLRRGCGGKVQAMSTATAVPERSASPVEGVRWPPLFHEGLVSRPRLVERLMDPAGPPPALIAEPAGYGKTTLLAEWIRDDPRPVGWTTLTP